MDPDPGREADGSPWRQGRGASANPPNRFQGQRLIFDGDLDPADDPAPTTTFLDDTSRSLLTPNPSRDVPFDFGLNPYRGCEHGCAYCYAREYHEYAGFSAGLDFESKILVKLAAPDLLRTELMRPGWKSGVIGMSGATDCYQPVERRLRLTRACLTVLAEFRQPVGIITKNALVVRDADLLAQLARHDAVTVALSLTTLDPDLARDLEPRASAPAARLQAIRDLSAAGIPACVNVAPVIPGLNDHEIPAILAAARAAGAIAAGFQVVRLSAPVQPIFAAWIKRFRPNLESKVLGRIAAVHGGGPCDNRPGQRHRGEGIWAEQIAALFHLHQRRLGFAPWPTLNTQAFQRPGEGRQLTLFDL